VISIHPLGNHKALKQPKKVSVPFSEDEIQELFDHFNRSSDSDAFEKLRDRLIVELLYTLGVRRSELIGIKDRDLDTDSHTVKIYGKGGKERLLPLLPSTVDLVKEYVKKRGVKFQNSSFSSFLVTDKGQELYPKLVYRKINVYLKGVSVKQKKSPHMIRHTFATHLLNRGADLNTVKELLGHSSLAATQVYTHSSIEELKMVYQSSHPRGNQSSS
jgi:integrase/recombinase XerC